MEARQGHDGDRLGMDISFGIRSVGADGEAMSEEVREEVILTLALLP